MIVHIKRQDSNGTVSNFCVFAIDENEAKLKVKDLSDDNVGYVYTITGYEYAEH